MFSITSPSYRIRSHFTNAPRLSQQRVGRGQRQWHCGHQTRPEAGGSRCSFLCKLPPCLLTPKPTLCLRLGLSSHLSAAPFAGPALFLVRHTSVTAARGTSQRLSPGCLFYHPTLGQGDHVLLVALVLALEIQRGSDYKKGWKKLNNAILGARRGFVPPGLSRVLQCVVMLKAGDA